MDDKLVRSRTLGYRLADLKRLLLEATRLLVDAKTDSDFRVYGQTVAGIRRQVDRLEAGTNLN